MGFKRVLNAFINAFQGFQGFICKWESSNQFIPAPQEVSMKLINLTTFPGLGCTKPLSRDLYQCKEPQLHSKSFKTSRSVLRGMPKKNGIIWKPLQGTLGGFTGRAWSYEISKEFQGVSGDLSTLKRKFAEVLWYLQDFRAFQGISGGFRGPQEKFRGDSDTFARRDARLDTTPIVEPPVKIPKRIHFWRRPLASTF